MRSREHDQPVRPFCRIPVSFDAAPRSWICFVKPAFASAFTTVSRALANFRDDKLPITRIFLLIDWHRRIPQSRQPNRSLNPSDDRDEILNREDTDKRASRLLGLERLLEMLSAPPLLFHDCYASLFVRILRQLSSSSSPCLTHTKNQSSSSSSKSSSWLSESFSQKEFCKLFSAKCATSRESFTCRRNESRTTWRDCPSPFR